MKQKKSPIWVGFIAWRDFEEHGLQLNAVQRALNDAINLTDYGSSIISFNFIPMALRPTNNIHEEKITYSSRKKEINIHLKLDYQQVINAGVQGFLPLVGQLLLAGIDQAAQKRVKDFDWVRFKQDISDLLAENGWLLPVNQL